VSNRLRGVVLVCEECGERVVLAGPLSTWRSEDAVFECGCGEGLTLAARLEEETTELETIPSARKPRRRC
jgi:vacuolar-type H+-ATPase catalytic subunit A/Vma1